MMNLIINQIKKKYHQPIRISANSFTNHQNFNVSLTSNSESNLNYNSSRVNNLLFRLNNENILPNMSSNIQYKKGKNRKSVTKIFDDIFLSNNLNSFSLNKSNNFNTTYSRNMHLNLSKNEVERIYLYTNPQYPINLKDDMNLFRSTFTNFSKEKLKKMNIIENLDEPNIMNSYLDNDDFMIYDEKYTHDKINNNIKFLKSKDFKEHHLLNYKLDSEYFKKQSFKIKNNKNINLYLHGLSIKIYEKNNKHNYIKFQLPLNLILFFYAISNENYFCFISKILSTENFNDNINNLKINYNEIEKYVNYIYKNNCDLFSSESNLFDSKSNKIKIFSLLLKNKEYVINFYPAILEFEKDANKILKIVSKGLLLNLIKKDYKNWDILCLCYLSSIKNFRKCYNFLNSKSILNIFDKEIKFKDKICNLDYNENNYEIKMYNKDHTHFSFFTELINLENKNEIFYVTFHSLIISIENKNNNKLHVNNFELTFKQVSLINKILELTNIPLKNVIYKCLILSPKTLIVNLDVNLLKDVSIKKIKNNFFDINPKNEFLKNLNIILLNSYLKIHQIKFIDENNCFQFTYDKFMIDNETFYDLLDKPENEWTETFLTFKIKNIAYQHRVNRSKTLNVKKYKRTFLRSKTKKYTSYPYSKLKRLSSFTSTSNQI